MEWFRRWAAVAAVTAVACLSGCFKLNVNLGGNGGGKAGEGASAPAQLPADEGGGGSWADLASRYAGGTFLGAEHGALFYAFDTLAYPKEPVELAVKLTSTRTLKAIPGVVVAISSGEWVAGRVATGEDGVARLQWTPPEAGEYTFTATVVGVPDEDHQELLQITPAELLVAARPKDTPFVVVDLDHTVVDSSFFRVLLDGGRPMADSAAVLGKIAERYGVIYLTHRPDLLTRRSKSFLKDNGYPPGPLLVSELKDVFDSGQFKTAKLSEVRKAFPGVALGIGDKLSDAQAYVDNGLAAYLIPHYKDKPEDLREMAAEIRKLRGQGRLQVVSDWRQIEQGIFQKRSFPPAAFAAALEKRAQQVEAEERRREKDDD